MGSPIPFASVEKAVWIRDRQVDPGFLLRQANGGAGVALSSALSFGSASGGLSSPVPGSQVPFLAFGVAGIRFPANDFTAGLIHVGFDVLFRDRMDLNGRFSA